MSKTELIPHFVADRPMSLRILSGLDLERHPINIGLMIQACTTDSFREMVSKFPCIDLKYCGVVDGPCPFGGDLSKCSKGKSLQKHVTTIADSGVFTKNGSVLDYPELFNRYEQMGIERGIMLDVLGDAEETIKSAKVAWDIYSSGNYSFKLIGVSQGRDPEEYATCYEKLTKIGYEEIAIGGLLTKFKNTARYASSNKEIIAEVVKKIKSQWPDDRCFTLGVYNPKRHEFLESLGVNAADYKGWIFQYEKKYDDPFMHHVDRILQVRSFIEEKILSPVSGQPVVDKSIDSMALKMRECVSLVGKKVVVKSNKESKNTLKIDSFESKPKQIVIISCGKSKNKVSKCMAKDAYNGRSFLLKREYAELSSVPWFILSAKYGLIRPKRIINPNYDKTVSSAKDISELASKIKKQVSQYPEFFTAKDILFLGPEAYVKALNTAFSKNKNILHPTKGLNQGKSQKMIKSLLSSFLEESTSQNLFFDSI
ncbi:MAG TPA: hypothetical protein HA262_11460 [Methanosarcina sp.]|nr:hypothetical protein [Methanosarcina sp.]